MIGEGWLFSFEAFDYLIYSSFKRIKWQLPNIVYPLVLGIHKVTYLDRSLDLEKIPIPVPEPSHTSGDVTTPWWSAVVILNEAHHVIKLLSCFWQPFLNFLSTQQILSHNGKWISVQSRQVGQDDVTGGPCAYNLLWVVNSHIGSRSKGAWRLLLWQQRSQLNLEAVAMTTYSHSWVYSENWNC